MSTCNCLWHCWGLESRPKNSKKVLKNKPWWTGWWWQSSWWIAWNQLVTWKATIWRRGSSSQGLPMMCTTSFCQTTTQYHSWLERPVMSWIRQSWKSNWNTNMLQGYYMLICPGFFSGLNLGTACLQELLVSSITAAIQTPVQSQLMGQLKCFMPQDVYPKEKKSVNFIRSVLVLKCV